MTHARRLAFLALVCLGACSGSGSSVRQDATEQQQAAPHANQRMQFRLSGTLRANDGSAVDGDVNDPHAPLRPNDSPASAQPIATPITLGGYAGLARAGSHGALHGRGDVSDFYRVHLKAGQAVSLEVAEPEAADLDLYLWNAAGDRLHDASTDTGAHETVRASESGTQLLEVAAYQGASNYLLVVGHDPIPEIQSGLQLSADFIPGE
ncbi:MAG TPA: hypothetical protein VF210_11785, partial [Pseudomonadales bacterium]